MLICDIARPINKIVCTKTIDDVKGYGVFVIKIHGIKDAQ